MTGDRTTPGQAGRGVERRLPAEADERTAENEESPASLPGFLRNGS
jgi:hypothetical protein